MECMAWNTNSWRITPLRLCSEFLELHNGKCLVGNGGSSGLSIRNKDTTQTFLGFWADLVWIRSEEVRRTRSPSWLLCKEVGLAKVVSELGNVVCAFHLSASPDAHQTWLGSDLTTCATMSCAKKLDPSPAGVIEFIAEGHWDSCCQSSHQLASQ